MAVQIHIKNVVKKYQDNVVIPNLSLSIKEGELFTLLGPSGCGKTTLLRMIAGFNTVEGGTIAFDDKVINDLPVYKRNFGMVFQNYAIFPNMTVYQNIEYGLKNKKLDKEQIASRVKKIMQVVQIEQYKDRYPNMLSGGQQQRVALARAIVVQPQVLLMDEPLSNLDAKLRVEMREAISDIQKKIGITTVYVTHDQEEALSVSDRIAVMSKGVIQQVATPTEIYTRPCNTFVANFIGQSNSIKAEVVDYKEQTATLRLETGLVTKVKKVSNCKAGDEVLVYVRPEEFTLAEAGQGMPAKVLVRRFLGKYMQYVLDLGIKHEVEMTLDISTVDKHFAVGETINLDIKANKVNVFDSATLQTMILGGQNAAQVEI